MKFAIAHHGVMPDGDCFPCIVECVKDPAMAWDYETSAETIDREDSVTVAITGLNKPFTWSVSGTGFSLEHETTEGLTNTLYADDTACGSATITVTGCDDTETTGYVRCTIGQWTALADGCMLSGTADTHVWSEPASRLTMEKTEGKYHQIDKVKISGGVGVGGCDAADCSVFCNVTGCIGCINCLTIEFCSHVILGGNPAVQCKPWCCGFFDCVDIGYCFCTQSHQYKEWIC